MIAMGDYGILCVGLVCVDIINEVESYPVEDTDQRCLSQRWQRGGNASNNCTVLGVLGAKPHFMGTISDTIERRFIEDDFKEFGVDFSSSILVKQSECPISCVIVSMATGSRTIIHSNKNLRELTFEDFFSINLDQFSWIHFEGRNVRAMKQMMTYVHQLNEEKTRKVTLSVEIEKARVELQDLIPLADFVFVSKDYAQFKGWMNLEDALENLSKFLHKEATVICPWGDQGAGAKVGCRGSVLLSPPFPPERVLDTLGAGDTFIASTIFALSIGESLERSITFGCRIAGFKIGLKGWSELKASIHQLDSVKDLILKLKRVTKI